MIIMESRTIQSIFAIHIHDNDEKLDTHSQLDKTSWCLKVISRKCFNDVPIVLESTNLTIEQIIQQVDLIEKFLNKGLNLKD